MNLTGIWRIVSSPDFDNDYLGMDVEPYVELQQNGNRVSSSYQAGLQQGNISGRLDGDNRASFSFEGVDEMDDVHGRGELRLEGAQMHFVLAYHRGDTYTFICEQIT